MKTLIIPALLALTISCFSLSAHAEAGDAAETKVSEKEDSEAVLPEGGSCNQDNFQNCVTNECSTDPRGISRQCRAYCKKITGC